MNEKSWEFARLTAVGMNEWTSLFILLHLHPQGVPSERGIGEL